MATEPLTVVFLGTPEFAAPALEKLMDNNSCRVVAVITQPDRPAGRGLKLTPPPVKLTAETHGIPVFQPTSIKKVSIEDDGEKPRLVGGRCPELLDFLNEHHPIDLFAVAAYGKIIPSSLLNYPRFGNINIHPSLLPRWRGAAPIQRALFNGDSETGVTIMQVDEGLDSGPILLQSAIPITEIDTLETLHDRLSELGAELLSRCISDHAAGTISPVPQPEEGVTYAEKWEKSDSEINWNDAAPVILRRIRTCCPFPGARTSLSGMLIKIYEARQVPDLNYPPAAPGTIVECNKAELVVKAGQDSFISIDIAQLEGKKRMSIAELMRGFQFETGSVFS